MNVLTKIKAGAIQYVLVLSVIIIILLFAFISLVFLQKKTFLKSNLYKETIHASYLSFDYLSKQEIPYDTETKLTFTEHTYEDTRILKKRWGVFDLAIVNAELKNEKTQKIALLGNVNEHRKALYLQENNQPLKLVGNTKITGDVSLPKRGVSTGNIAGTSYYGNKLVYGEVATNANQLPAIQNLNHLKDLSSGVIPYDVTYFNLEEDLQLNQSFADETLLFETTRDLTLRNITLQGNIILISSTKIEIDASAKLENIIVIAPEIVVKESAKISCQLVASKSILVKENARMLYPSALILMEDNTSKKENSTIEIANNTDIRGAVLYHSEKKEVNYEAQVFVHEKSTITGEVYCNKNLELNGSVYGFVYAGGFITKQFGGVFVNHIYNGIINSEAISENYCGLFIDQNNVKVAKWLE